MNWKILVTGFGIPFLTALITTYFTWKVIDYKKAKKYGITILQNILICYVYTVHNAFDSEGKLKKTNEAKGIYIEMLKYIQSQFQGVSGNIYWLDLLESNPEINRFMIHLFRDYGESNVANENNYSIGVDTIKAMEKLYKIVKEENKKDYENIQFLKEMVVIVDLLMKNVKEIK